MADLDKLYEKNNFSGFDRQQSRPVINALIEEIKKLKSKSNNNKINLAGKIPNCS